MGLLLEQDSWQIHRQLSYDVSVFVTLKEIPLKWNLPRDFCQTLPIGCLCCRNLNFKIKSGCPHTHFGAGATCLYTLIPYNTNKIILTSTCFDHISDYYSFHFVQWELVYFFQR